MHYPIIAPLRGSHGLSARRARRTKSARPEGPKAGPKGRKLEVGARRAPRLLVYYNFQKVPVALGVWGGSQMISKGSRRVGEGEINLITVPKFLVGSSKTKDVFRKLQEAHDILIAVFKRIQVF